jgi:hypothetical protein
MPELKAEAGGSVEVETPNGAAYFYTASSVAGAMAAADAQAWAQAQSEVRAGPQIAVAAVVGALTALATAAGAGAAIASMVQVGEGGSSAPALEIQTTNLSSVPVVLYAYTPSYSWIAKGMQPLSSGETDTFLLTNDGPFSGGQSQIILNFIVGDILVAVTFAYVTSNVAVPGRWTVQATVDGAASSFITDESTSQLYAATFEGNSPHPTFDFFMNSIETGSGQIDLTFYDHA